MKNEEKSKIASRFKNKFSKIKLEKVKEIKTKPEIFQGRSVPFAKETVEKIIREGYDTSQDPIILFLSPKKEKIVISGHSRFEAARKLKLQTIPVKYFTGDLDAAIDYAVIESNRSAKVEGVESDIKAYIRSKQRGYNREFLLSIFKSESYIGYLSRLSNLNPKGQFIEELTKDSRKSFPYLERNSAWVGEIRKKYASLTNKHEQEIFDFFYKSDKKHLQIKKESFFDTIGKRVERPNFKSSEPLRLTSQKEFDYISESDPGYRLYRQTISLEDQLHADHRRKLQLSVEAEKMGESKLSEKLRKEAQDIRHAARLKHIEVLKLNMQLSKEDKRMKTQGLF